MDSYANLISRWQGKGGGVETEKIFGQLTLRLGQLFANAEVTTGTNDPADDHIETDYFAVVEDAGAHEKWQIDLKGRSAADCTIDELRPLVDIGIPLKQRHVLWPLWWAHPQRGNVEDLHNLAEDAATAQIELDLARTLPGSFPENQRDALGRVLRAYAACNPKVGYCQGMSFIAAVPLLLAFSEADALAGLRYFIEEVCPGYHGALLEGYFRDLAVLDILTCQFLPDIHAEMSSLGIPFDMIATDHLLTISARTWPLHTVARLWDVVLLEGSAALLSSFLALLKVYLPKALEESRAARTQMIEMASDVAHRFMETSRTSIMHDIDTIIQRTRELIPVVRGDFTDGSSCKKGDFVAKIRAQLSSKNDAPDANTGETCSVDPVEKHVSDSNDDGSFMILLEARIKVSDGSIKTLRMGELDQPRDVAKRFAESHALDNQCATALAAWLKQVEAAAVTYPVKVEAILAEICDAKC